MKYLIGITASINKTQNLINSAYIKAFTTDKTTPVIIPNLFDFQNEVISAKEKIDLAKHIDAIAFSLDALILSGGTDINPTFLGDKIKDSSNFNFHRDYIETELIFAFLKLNKPVLGICRGFQLLGNLYHLNYWQQDISITKESHNGLNNDISNRKEPMHNVTLFGTFAEFCATKGVEGNQMLINSWHEQGFSLMPKGDRVKNKDLNDFITESVTFTEEKSTTKVNNYPNLDIIMTTNHVIEGFQHKTLPIVAFQNHPEEYTNSIALEYFVEKYLDLPRTS